MGATGGVLSWFGGTSPVMAIIAAVIWVIVILAIAFALDKGIGKLLHKRLGKSAVPASVIPT